VRGLATDRQQPWKTELDQVPRHGQRATLDTIHALPPLCNGDFSVPKFPDIVSLIGDWFLTFDGSATVRGAIVLYFH
jgi:hypothetical protein